VVTFRNGRLSDVTLHPITIESSSAPTDGYPHPASPEQGRRILERLRGLSSAFGTPVAIEGAVGVVRPVK
jgi:hypothetical protein